MSVEWELIQLEEDIRRPTLDVIADQILYGTADTNRRIGKNWRRQRRKWRLSRHMGSLRYAFVV